MRRLPTLVPETMGRLLQSDPSRRAPLWYQPVMQNPPPVQPNRRQRERPRLNKHDIKGNLIEDNKERHKKTPVLLRGANTLLKQGPREISYPEDEIRRHFFRDFPWEAMRPTTLLENREVKQEDRAQGDEWTKLEQRGRYPTVEECAHSLHTESRDTDGHQYDPICPVIGEPAAHDKDSSVQHGGGSVCRSASKARDVDHLCRDGSPALGRRVQNRICEFHNPTLSSSLRSRLIRAGPHVRERR